ncbi:MAG: alkaline phosphatase family protein [Candidatus Methanosuratincola sp.]
MQLLLIVADGMADLPIGELGGKTPLQAAGAENLDSLAAKGRSGLMDPPILGIPPGSDVAHLNFLGYDPRLFYTGRGPLEAAGAGIEMAPDGVFYRCNLCRLSPDGVVVDEKVELDEGRRKDVERQINQELQDRFECVQVRFRFTLGYRGVLALIGKGLVPEVNYPQPKRLSSIPVRPLGVGAGGAKTAELLFQFKELSGSVVSEAVRMKRPNECCTLIPWGGGRIPVMPSFQEKHHMKGAGIAAVPLIKGICKLCGMHVPEVQGATGKPDTDLISKAKYALDALEEFDFVILHVEATDELSHDGDLQGKISMIRRIDDMVGFLLERIDLQACRLAVLADHVTSTEMRRHTADPVPVVVAGWEFDHDGVKEYSEPAAANGKLGRFNGSELLPILLGRGA